jgi:hypothetical protein
MKFMCAAGITAPENSGCATDTQVDKFLRTEVYRFRAIWAGIGTKG